MLVLVCGSRTWKDSDPIRARLAQLPRGTIILHGGARGADQIAGTIARNLGFDVRVILAEWTRYGRQAGMIRNQAMLEQRPELVIAFWDGRSRGTLNTLANAKARGIPLEVHRSASPDRP